MVNRDNLYLEVLHAWQADSENLVRYWNADLSESDLFKFSESVRNQHLKAIEVEIKALDASSINIEPVLPKIAMCFLPFIRKFVSIRYS